MKFALMIVLGFATAAGQTPAPSHAGMITGKAGSRFTTTPDLPANAQGCAVHRFMGMGPNGANPKFENGKVSGTIGMGGLEVYRVNCTVNGKPISRAIVIKGDRQKPMTFTRTRPRPKQF